MYPMASVDDLATPVTDAESFDRIFFVAGRYDLD
jgi:hypothetical protein